MVKRRWNRPGLVIFMALLVSSCLGDVNMKIGFNMTPQQRDDGWEISTPAAEGLDPDALELAYRRFFSRDEFQTAYSLLVIRHGKLVAEGYCRDLKDIDRLNNIKSATKSVTSMVTGIAINEGLIGGVNDRVYDYIPEFFDSDIRKRDITIYDLLTMRSGLKWDNGKDNYDWLVDEPTSSLRYMLSRELEWAPGTYFNYSDLNPHVMSGVLHRVTALRMSTYAREKLLEPLGITDFFWEEYGPDKITHGAFGLYLKPRDFAKLGLLALGWGDYKGKHIVPTSWMVRSTTAQANRNEGGYGYYWWIRPDYNAFAAVGHGGQILYAMPDHDMLMVITANTYTNQDLVAVSIDDAEKLVQMIENSIRN